MTQPQPRQNTKQETSCCGPSDNQCCGPSSVYNMPIDFKTTLAARLGTRQRPISQGDFEAVVDSIFADFPNRLPKRSHNEYVKDLMECWVHCCIRADHTFVPDADLTAWINSLVPPLTCKDY